jgi:hypothetical protein
MARLPIPGSDDGTWGAILNDYLGQAHDSDGTLKSNAVTNGAIADGAVTEAKLDTAVQTKLNTVSSGVADGAVTDIKVNASAAIAQSKISGLTTDLAAKAADSAVVHNTGAEAVAGVKTFSSSPVVPTPSTGTAAANKTYIDTAVTDLQPVVEYNGSSYPARPSTSKSVIWQGPSSADPAVVGGAIDGDIWRSY